VFYAVSVIPFKVYRQYSHYIIQSLFKFNLTLGEIHETQTLRFPIHLNNVLLYDLIITYMRCRKVLNHYFIYYIIYIINKLNYKLNKLLNKHSIRPKIIVCVHYSRRGNADQFGYLLQLSIIVTLIYCMIYINYYYIILYHILLLYYYERIFTN